MNERRKLQTRPVRTGAILAFLVVLGGAGLFTYYSYQGVLTEDGNASQTAATSNRSSRSNSGAAGGGVRGGGGLQSASDIREAAREMDRQLMAKLANRRSENEQASDLSYDDNYDSEDNRDQVTRDYKQVKKTKQLSKGMKADFKKHYQNIVRDTLD